MDADFRNRILELKFAGNFDEAVRLVRKRFVQGDVAAKVMLARMGEWANLSRDEVDRLIMEAEHGLHHDDVFTHLELYGAYSEGLGRLDYEEKAARSFSHLLAAAEHNAGNSYSLAVARTYLTGGLSVPSDLAKAKAWYRRAMEQGSQQAEVELNALNSEK